jgi:hypothetical protein
VATRLMLPAMTGSTVYLVIATSEKPNEIHLFLTDRPRTATDRVDRERPAAEILQYVPLSHLLSGHLYSLITSTNGSAEPTYNTRKENKPPPVVVRQALTTMRQDSPGPPTHPRRSALPAGP